jgi:hypothetical protein
MALLYRKRVLAAQIETAAGTAETLDATDAAINVFDLKYVPDLPLEERMGQGVIDRLPSVPGAKTGTVTFWVDMFGADPDPFWFATFLPACGMPVATYAAIAKKELVGTNVKTLTMALYQDGNCYKLRGCAGTVVFRMTAGKRMRAEFTFKGVYVAAAAATILAPTYPAASGIIFESSALLIGSYAPQISELVIDLNSDVQPLLDSKAADGIAYFQGSGPRPKGTMDPASSLIGTKDLYGELISMTTAALSLACGTHPNKLSFAAPKVQWTKIDQDERQPLAVEKVTFDLLESVGEDALTITNNVA